MKVGDRLYLFCTNRSSLLEGLMCEIVIDHVPCAKVNISEPQCLICEMRWNKVVTIDDLLGAH